MYQVEDNEQSLRFSDPHQVPEKVFELHSRKDLPRLIKKCQAVCGKVIRVDEKSQEQDPGQIEKLDQKNPSLVQCTFTLIHDTWKPLTKKTIMDQGSASITK